MSARPAIDPPRWLHLALGVLALLIGLLLLGLPLAAVFTEALSIPMKLQMQSTTALMTELPAGLPPASQLAENTAGSKYSQPTVPVMNTGISSRTTPMETSLPIQAAPRMFTPVNIQMRASDAKPAHKGCSSAGKNTER